MNNFWPFDKYTNLDGCKIIPHNWCPSNFYIINFSGWKKITISADNAAFLEISEIASMIANSLIEKYKSTHALTEPHFSIKPDGTFYVKIGTMDIELYEMLSAKKN